MPVTSTAINAKSCKIYLDDELGVLQDISGSANEVQIDLDRKLGDFNVFGDDETYRLEGKKDGSIDLTVLYTRATKEGFRLVRDWREAGGARTIRVDVPDSSTGADRYEGEVLAEKISIPLKADEAKPIPVKLTLKAHGKINPTTVP